MFYSTSRTVRRLKWVLFIYLFAHLFVCFIGNPFSEVVCCHLFLVSGIWSLFRFSFSFLPPTTLKKREGWKLQQLPNTHDLTWSHLSQENCNALKFWISRANFEHYFIILSQLKWNRSFSHDSWAGKTQMFWHFECIPPGIVTHFSHQAHPRQLLLF